MITDQESQEQPLRLCTVSPNAWVSYEVQNIKYEVVFGRHCATSCSWLTTLTLSPSVAHMYTESSRCTYRAAQKSENTRRFVYL